MDNKIVSEISLKCGDYDCKDFQREIYEDAYLTASRKVAKRYRLLHRFFTSKFEIAIPENENESEYLSKEIKKPIVLGVPSFYSEYNVKINGHLYIKAQSLDDFQYRYIAYKQDNNLMFNYYPRTKSDEITMMYVADVNIEDFDEDIEPIIPSQYKEELMAFACVEMAKLGIVKFGESEKGKKYHNVFNLYRLDERNLEKNLIKDTAWVEMKIWHVV